MFDSKFDLESFLAKAVKANAEERKPIFTPMKKACEIAHISRWTMRRWIKNGHVRAIKVGKAKSSRVMIDEASLYAFLASQEINIKNTTKGGESK